MALILATIYILLVIYVVGVWAALFYILFWEMEFQKDYPKIGYDLMWSSWFWFFINPHLKRKKRK
jgi:hypothetical protein